MSAYKDRLNVELGGWKWQQSLGSWWGYGPDGEQVIVARQVMSSPWWTIGDEDFRDVNLQHIFEDWREAAVFAIELYYKRKLAEAQHDERVARSRVEAAAAKLGVFHRARRKELADGR